MGFRRRAGGGKRDSSEADIVAALRKAGARVFFIGGTGNPDLAVWHLDRPFLMEVKTGKGKATENQQDIPWPTIRTPEEALALIITPFGRKVSTGRCRFSGTSRDECTCDACGARR